MKLAFASGRHKTSSSRLAIVAPQALAFGLGRMFQTQRELARECYEQGTKQVGVFHTMGEALAFLQIDHPLVMPQVK